MSKAYPSWLDTTEAEKWCRQATLRDVEHALGARTHSLADFAALISPAAAPLLESMAQRARQLTQHHFGQTISLYVPLYLSNYCAGGCAYCGFASDRPQLRRRLEPHQVVEELSALAKCGFEDVLLLTGERCREADFDYVLAAVSEAARHFHSVSIETFAMSGEEYQALEVAGCTGVTLYQETYDANLYAELHRWGAKRDFTARLDAPDRALQAGLRVAGIGALLGLDDPRREAIRLYSHAERLRRSHWRSGVMVSFPRIRPQLGGFQPAHPVTDRLLAQLVFAFRICFPDTHLVLSTRETPAFRDGMAGVGITRMSVASRTTVGGYASHEEETAGQFDVSDARDVDAFCAMLRLRGLEPVFKNWDSVFQGMPHAALH